MKKKMVAYRQEWIESERGWGQRPDGYSLHSSKEEYDKYIKEYWEKMPKHTPEVYSTPSGVLKLVEISEKEFKALKKKPSLRFY